MEARRLLCMLLVVHIFQAMFELLLVKKTKLSGLSFNATSVDDSRMTSLRRRYLSCERRSKATVRSTRTLTYFIGSKRALSLIRYAMAALILQRAGDVAVLLNPGPAYQVNDSISDSSGCEMYGELKEIFNCSGMKFVHQNVRSLLSKIDELRILIADLNNNIHFLTLSEIWRDILDSEINIDGYRLFRKDCNRNGGGVVIYVRDDLNVVERLDITDSIETLWVHISLPHSRGFLLGTFYRPPNTSDYCDMDYMHKMEAILDTVVLEGNEVLIMADFNCDFLRSRLNNCETKQLKFLFKSFGFSQMINQPTRVTNEYSTCLDLVAVNCPKNISKSGVYSSCLGDHNLVYAIRKLNNKKVPPVVKCVRNYSKYNKDLF